MTKRRTWILAQLTVVAVVGLMPVLQFLDANPYFKFRYGFDEKLLALTVLVFFAIPAVIGVALGHPPGSEAGLRRCRIALAIGVLLFASQLDSTTLHAAPAAVRPAAAAAALVLGGLAIRRRAHRLAWSLALASVVVLPYTAFQVYRHWWWIPKPPHTPSMRGAGVEPARNDIFVFFLDGCTLTSDYLDPEHYPDATWFPNLHRFVREDAVWFYNALSNGPGTMLSLPTMFTGKLYQSRHNDYLANEETIFCTLKPRYAVRLWLHTKSAFCSDEDFQRCHPFEKQRFLEPMRILVESWAYISSFRLAPTSYAIGKLDEANYHREAFVGDFLARVSNRAESPQFYTIQLFDRGLDGLKDFDRLLGEFVRILEQQGRYESSIIAIVSDHGLNVDGGRTAYGPLARQIPRLYRVPFALKSPGRGGGRIDPYPAQGVDIVPTILARVLPDAELRSRRFDGVDVLVEHPARQHWINMREPGKVYRLADPTGSEPGLVEVSTRDAGL